MKIIIEGDFTITNLESTSEAKAQDYDSDGWSTQVNLDGSLSHKSIDEKLAEWSHGTWQQKQAAHKFKQYFLFMHPRREYSEDQEYQIYRNMQGYSTIFGLLGSMLFDAWLYPEWFVNKVTGFRSYKFKGLSENDGWEKINGGKVLLKNAHTCVMGNNSWVKGRYADETSPNIEKFLKAIPVQAMKQLEGALTKETIRNNSFLLG